MKPGRSFCSVVESNNCFAPSGYRLGTGVGIVAGVARSELHECAYCADLVCSECSIESRAPAFMRRRGSVRVCTEHEGDELVAAGYLPLSA